MMFPFSFPLFLIFFMTSPNTILETNIERILEDHLWNEVGLINTKIKSLTEEIDELVIRKDKLIKIAEAANITSHLDN